MERKKKEWMNLHVCVHVCVCMCLCVCASKQSLRKNKREAQAHEARWRTDASFARSRESSTSISVRRVAAGEAPSCTEPQRRERARRTDKAHERNAIKSHRKHERASASNTDPDMSSTTTHAPFISAPAKQAMTQTQTQTAAAFAAGAGAAGQLPAGRPTAARQPHAVGGMKTQSPARRT